MGEYRVEAGPVFDGGVVTDPRMSVIVPSYVLVPALRYPRVTSELPGGVMRLRGAWDELTAYPVGSIVSFDGKRFIATAGSTGEAPYGTEVVTADAVDTWAVNGTATFPVAGKVQFHPDAGNQAGNVVLQDLIDLAAGAVVVEFTAGGSGADGYSVGFVPSTASLGGQGGNVALIETDGFGLKLSSYDSNARWLNDIPGQETSNAYLGGTDFNTAQSYRATFTKSGSTVTARLQRLTGTTFDESHDIPNLVVTHQWHLALGGASGGISGTHWMDAVTVSFMGSVTSASWEPIGVML